MAYQKRIDVELLQAALAGYQHQYQALSERMDGIRQQLEGRGRGASDHGTTTQTRSAETREGMAAAQRRRWAKQGSGTAKRKRNMSAEGKARIAEATRKRWEAYRAAKAKASK